MNAAKRDWRESLMSVVEDHSLQALRSRPLWKQELDAQGLLCSRCGFRLGEGVEAVGRSGTYVIRPCPKCARYKYDQLHPVA